MLKWSTNLEKELRSKLKQDQLKSDLLTDDIMRYTAEIRDIPMDSFGYINDYVYIIPIVPFSKENIIFRLLCIDSYWKNTFILLL
jgi:hypothetical protein